MADILNSELSVSLHLFRSTHNIESSHFFQCNMAAWKQRSSRHEDEKSREFKVAP